MEVAEIEKRIENLKAYSKIAWMCTVVLQVFISLLFIVSFIFFVGNSRNYTLVPFLIQMILLVVIIILCVFYSMSKVSQAEYADYLAGQYTIEARKIKKQVTSEIIEEDTMTLCGFVEIDITPYRDILNNEYDKLSSNMFFPKK